MDPKALNYDPDAEKESGDCRYEEEADDPPSTYDFKDADLSSTKVRIELLHLLTEEVRKGSNGSTVQLQDLLDPYRNNGVAGNGGSDLVGTLRDVDSAFFRNLFSEIASRSGDPNSLVDGRFVSTDSIAYLPLVEKGLMLSSFFRYSTDRLLEDLDQATHDDPEASNPTEREKLYDEAFGLFGAPKDFSRNTPFGSSPNYEAGAWFWSEALLRTDSATGELPSLFDAFVEGRWALTHEKTDRRADAVRRVEKGWEKLGGALMIRHIKRCIRAIDDNDTGGRIWHWSQAHGVLLFLDLNGDGVIDPSSHQELRDRLGDSPNECTAGSLNDALAILQNVYGFDNDSLQAL